MNRAFRAGFLRARKGTFFERGSVDELSISVLADDEVVGFGPVDDFDGSSAVDEVDAFGLVDEVDVFSPVDEVDAFGLVDEADVFGPDEVVDAFGSTWQSPTTKLKYSARQK